MKLNGRIITEKNFGIVPNDINVWDGELPYGRGNKFPTEDIIKRANIINTNNMLYNNEFDEIYSSLLSVIPEVDPIYGYQIREIIARLPYFKNSTDNWVALCGSKKPIIDGRGNSDIKVSTVCENSNLQDIIIEELQSRFIAPYSVYKICEGIEGTPIIENIPTKNCILFFNKEHLGQIEVVVVFNIYKSDRGSDICEFIEYHYDGKIVRRAFNYASGTLGREIEELHDEGTAFENCYISPIVVSIHNRSNTNKTGVDQYRYWEASIVGAMRELQNVFRVAERIREIIRKVPDSAISKDNVTGASTFMNKGTIGYNENAEKIPEIEYAQPDMSMIDAAIKAFETALASVKMDTGLGDVFWSLEKAGSNLSAKSIEAMMYPIKLKLNMIHMELTSVVKDIAVKLSCLYNININKSDIDVYWPNTFPRDEKEYTDAIMSRVNAEHPTLSVEDAISKLDDLSIRDAKVKALELKGITVSNSEVHDEQSDEEDESNESIGINANASGQTEGTGVGANYTNGDDIDNHDSPLWENQLPLGL